MISTAAMRRLGPWVVGLFIIGQIFGVVPLVSGHTAHVAEAELASSLSGGVDHAAHHKQHHHRGDADGCAQHHALQDLSGAPAPLLDCCEIVFAEVALTVPPPRMLAASDPVRLERPPKSSLSV